MASEIVRYSTQDGTEVEFEIEARAGFQPAQAGSQVVNSIRSAVGPAVDAAKEVIDRAKLAAPDQVEVTFGIAVNGAANWWVARTGTEANFTVTLTWKNTGGG